MKTKLTLLVIVFLCAVINVKAGEGSGIKGDSMTSLGTYEIKTSTSPLEISGTSFQTHLLTYEHAERPIHIGIENKKKCINFIVKGPNFEVEYFCNRGIFGVKKISHKYQEIEENINLAVIDKDQLDAQRIITQSPKTEKELLGLIACYLPNLIKEKYRTQI